MWQTKYTLAVPKNLEWEWIFVHAVKAISSLGVHSLWSGLFNIHITKQDWIFDIMSWKLHDRVYFFSIVVVTRHVFVNVHSMIIIFHTFLFNCLIELLTNFDKNIWKLLEWDYFFSIVVVARHSFVNVHLMIIMMGIANKNNEFDDRTDRPLLSLGTIHILHCKYFVCWNHRRMPANQIQRQLAVISTDKNL